MKKICTGYGIRRLCAIIDAMESKRKQSVMHHQEIEAGEKMAAELERQIREPMTDAYNEITRQDTIRVRDEAAIDLVNHPAHYAGKIECIDVLEQLAADGHDFRALHAIRYLWRYRHKGGDESIRKAIWYLRRMLGEV